MALKLEAKKKILARGGGKPDGLLISVPLTHGTKTLSVSGSD